MKSISKNMLKHLSFSVQAKLVVASIVGLSCLALPARGAINGNGSKNLRVLESLPLFEGFERKSSSENDKTNTLIEIFTKIQNESKNKNSLNRGTHAKGSCFIGETKILSADEHAAIGYNNEIIHRIRKGLFAQAGTIKTHLRFANAKGTRNDDTAPDVRAVSFSFDTAGREQSANGDYAQDFMFNSSPMFAVWNINQFTELMKAARTAQGDIYFINPFHFVAINDARKLLNTYERSDVKSYATENYWSNVPYSHGLTAQRSPSEVVKYKLTPCDGLGIRRENSTGKSKHFLQIDIDEKARNGEICFDLQVQLFDQKKLEDAGIHGGWSTVDWIENGGALWPERILPYYTVAKIQIASGAAENGLSSERVGCEDLAFNTRIHSSRAHQPLGSISRVRAYVEENSRSRRMREKQ